MRQLPQVPFAVRDNCLRQLSRTAKDISSAKQLPQAVVSHCQRFLGSCLALQDFKTPVLQLIVTILTSMVN